VRSSGGAARWAIPRRGTALIARHAWPHTNGTLQCSSTVLKKNQFNGTEMQFNNTEIQFNGAEKNSMVLKCSSTVLKCSSTVLKE
jgi:hypothetical protein